MEFTNSEDNAQQKSERTSRSVLRTRGRPKKSPGRLSPGRRSPGRQSPGRRSPARRSPARRSPARKSPARSPSSRTRKLTTRNVRIAQISIPRTEMTRNEKLIEETKTDIENSKDNEDIAELMPLQSRIRETSQVTRRSTRILSNMMKNERQQRLISLTRSVDRAASLPIDRRTHMYDIVAEQRERGLSMQRDRDLSKILHYEEEALPDLSTMAEKSSKKEIETISIPQEWGGWFGALCLIFVLPIAIIVPQFACFNGHCGSDKFSVPAKWQFYINFHVFAFYAGYISFIALVSLLPIGQLIDGQQNKTGRLQYRINGIISALMIISIFALCEYKSYGICDFILHSCLQLSIVGWIIGTVMAIGLYIRGGKIPTAALNLYGTTNNVIYDFWQGREVNPRIGFLDVKLLLVRANVIATLILNSAVLAKSMNDEDIVAFDDLNLTVLAICFLHIFYCLDNLVFESATLTSFKFLYEGTGYMICVGNLLYPFLLTLGTRYLLYQKIHQSTYVLVPIVVSFFIGYAIYRLSNSLKNEFRKNPFSSALSHFETITTFRGKRIISSGLWGHVRHPNYLGDIIIHWSLACAALTKDLLPYYPAILCTITLIYRAIRDDKRCKSRYGSAWEQYCLRVKSKILKRVF